MKTRLKILIILLIAIVAISTVSAVSAKDINIGPNTPGGLKKAVDTAKDGDTIILQNGVYKGKNNRDIAINKNIKIVGKGSNVVFDGEGKYKFLKINKNKKVALQKITFTKGNYKNTLNFNGLIHSEGDLTVNSCTFTNNKGTKGAINSRAGTLTVSRCTFKNNQAISSGAIESRGSKCTISKSTFTNNKATNGPGGAISFASRIGGILTINDCIFTNNQAGRSGGAIYSLNKEFTVSKSTFTNNQAKVNGGAIYTSGKSATVSKSTFTDNKSNGVGGAICNSLNPMKITDSQFKNNKDKKNAAIASPYAISLSLKNIDLNKLEDSGWIYWY